MHRFAAWGLSAALSSSLIAPAVAADPVPAAESARPSWLGRLFGASTEPKPEQEKTFGNVPVRAPVIIGPMDPVVLAAALKAEQDAYQRRLDVCLRLRELAAEMNDEQLTRQALELERQATALFHQRTARLGVKSALRSPGDDLDRTQSTTTAGEAIRVAPPKPANGPATTTTDRFREVVRD